MDVRTTGAVLALAALVGGCAVVSGGEVEVSGLPPATVAAPDPAPALGPTHETLEGNEEDVQATLDAIAAAFLAADQAALRPWLTDPSSGFGQRWLQRAAAMADVPFASYTLRLDTSGADLTTPDLPGEDGLLVNVIEEHDLVGFEELGPLREHLFLTMRRSDDGRWTVAGDTDGESLGLVSADHLWDHGPVVATRQGPLLALHHPGQPSVGAVLDEAERALAIANDRWPLDWPGVVPVLVPADQDELAELLHVTFSLDNFIAFATATPIVDLERVDLAGSRIMLNTPRFLDRASATRERILVHELVHAASRPSSVPGVPSWLEEGVAQALGEEQSTTGTSLLAALANTDWEGSLPLDAEFSTGDRDDIFLSYQRAWSFVDWLADEFGTAAVGAFYLAAGQGSVGEPGTAEALVDRAAREVFDRPLADLLAAWRATL